MATSSIISNGTAADVSSDITLTGAQVARVSLRSAAAASGSLSFTTDMQARVDQKDSAGNYLAIDALALTPQRPAVFIQGPGVYRVSKGASSNSYGVDAESVTLAGGDATAANQTAQSTLIGAVTETAPASDTASSGLNGRLQRVAQRLTSLIALLPASLGIKTAANSLSVAPASDAVFAVGATTNPTDTLTRPADTTAYTANDLIANSTTAGSVVVRSFTATRVAAGSVSIPKMVLLTNHTTGFSAIGVTVRLWSAAPTYTNGDNGAYAVATGAAGFLGKYTGTFEQFADGAAAELIPAAGSFGAFKLASGSTVYWDLQVTGAPTPQSAKTFTLIPQLLQD